MGDGYILDSSVTKDPDCLFSFIESIEKLSTKSDIFGIDLSFVEGV